MLESVMQHSHVLEITSLDSNTTSAQYQSINQSNNQVQYLSTSVPALKKLLKFTMYIISKIVTLSRLSRATVYRIILQ